MQADSDIQWEHSHDYGDDNLHRQKKVKTVFWLTTIVMILEIAAGTWSGSMALLADGWHMGTHSAAFAITIFAYAYAKKHANDRTFSFGTGKVNYLGGFASAIALAIVALMMIIESIQRLIEPHAIRFDEAIIVAIIGLTVNIASVFVLHESHHHHESGKDHQDHQSNHQAHPDHNMKAAYFHVLADTLTSVLAIVALLISKYFGWIWIDAMVGIVGAIVIARWSIGLIKETSEVLLDRSVESASLRTIAEKLKAINETVVSDIHVWKIAPGHCAAILSVTSKNPLASNEYRKILKEQIPQLSHVSVEVKSLAAVVRQ